MTRTHRILRTFALAAALAGGTALAADPADLAARRTAAMTAAVSDGELLPRAKAFGELAALDGEATAKAYVECVAALGGRQAQLEMVHAQTLRDYEPFSGFTFHTQQEWDRKKKLTQQIESEEAKLADLAVVAQAALTGITKFADAAAIAFLERAAPADPEPRSRAILVGGILSNRASKGGDVLRKAMKDAAPLVRLSALEAIALRKDLSFLEDTAAGLKDAGWPIRRAAVRALAAMGDKKVVPYLVAGMQNEDGMLLEEYETALEALTGMKLGHFADAWRKWYDEHKEELAGGGKPPAVKAGKPAAKAVNYYGIEAVSRKVLFVIDISGSMKEEIGGGGEQTGVSAKDQLSGPKIEIAKRMLTDAIHKLEPATQFSIVIFNHQVRTFTEALVPATPENVGKADLEVMGLEPSGSTYAYGALRRAFEFAGVTGAPVTGKFDPLVDTIFFLSDGAPTDDDVEKSSPMDPAKILTAVREWNRIAKVRIHTIAIDPRIGKGAFVRFMQGLAAENGGTYTPVGAK